MGEPSPSYPVYEEEEILSGTDTDTASSAGEELFLANDPELCNMTEAEAGEHLCWAYQQAKSRWRRFTGKPTRQVRRFVRRRKGKGKGKGRKGKFSSSQYLAEMPDTEVEEMLF